MILILHHLFTYRTFIRHAVSMWYVGVSKSFSERNFLIPLVSFVSGTITRKQFKITYDAALLFIVLDYELWAQMILFYFLLLIFKIVKIITYYSFFWFILRI